MNGLAEIPDSVDEPEGEHPCEKHQTPVSKSPSLPGEGAPASPCNKGGSHCARDALASSVPKAGSLRAQINA